MPITDKQIETHKAANPGVQLEVLRNEDLDIEILVKPPSRAEWSRFRAMVNEDGQRPQAMRTLLLNCILEPSRGDFEAGPLSTYPGLSESFGADLVKMAGVNASTTRRKV